MSLASVRAQSADLNRLFDIPASHGGGWFIAIFVWNV